MKEYIPKDKVLELWRYWKFIEAYDDTKAMKGIDLDDYVPREWHDKVCEEMAKRHTADRPKGEWIYCEDYVGHDGYKCSECGFFVPWCYDVYADSNFIRHYHTCPHCDSRMKGADDE